MITIVYVKKLMSLLKQLGYNITQIHTICDPKSLTLKNIKDKCYDIIEKF